MRLLTLGFRPANSAVGGGSDGHSWRCGNVAIRHFRRYSKSRLLPLKSERRSDLVRTGTATVNHLHQLLMKLIPAATERK
jgi:hypothetical protein